MKRLRIIAALLATAIAPMALADNPIVQNLYTADPAPLVHGGRVYLYTSHDEDGAKYFTMKDWLCFSTDDMVNWTHHGSPLSLASFDWAEKNAWAPHVVERGGKFYFYVPVKQTNGGMSIGVAVGDSPTGPFKDALGKPLVSGGWGNIDPAVLVDDDGQAYLYYGNPQLRYVKLNADMISYDQAVGVVDVAFTPENFGKRTKDGDKRTTLYEEGPWPFKRNGLYYMVFAAGGIPEYIAYSTGPTATGPWTYRGVIMPTERGSFTNHPGVIDYEGNAYFFYHNGALPGGSGFTRSVAVEPFTFNADGSFPTINMTKEGLKAVKNLDPFKRTEAETICWASGIETASTDGTGLHVTDISDGDYIKVKSVDFGKTGAKRIRVNVSAAAEATIEIRLGSFTGQVVDRLIVKPTGNAWRTQTAEIGVPAGVHDLFFTFVATSASELRFDWWQFETN